MTSTIDQARTVAPYEAHGVLGPDGVVCPGARIAEPADLLLNMYRWMFFGRAYDARLFSLQRQGRITTYAPVAGQEAAQVGCSLALRQDDWLVPTYRDGLATAVHGVPPENLALLLRGHPKGGMIPPDVNVIPQQIGIAEQVSHAMGIAWGMKLRHAGTATLVLFGDGATSEGAFHEGANFAGVFKAPLVLVCQNNGWAISVPRSRQTAAETIAQKATAYGMPGQLVDGNDVIAMYRATCAALERARSGEGPSLIEALTYRIGPHTTADDPTRYREAGELSEWQDKRDPLTRLRIYLEREGLWDGGKQTALEEETRARVALAVTTALDEPAPPPEAIFDQLYAERSPALEAQRAELLAHLAKNNADKNSGADGAKEARHG